MTLRIDRAFTAPAEPRILTQRAGEMRSATTIPTAKITPSAQEQEVSRTWMEQLRALSAGPSALSGELNTTALSGLRLGSALSAEDERAAAQTARGAYSARGLAAGRPAAAAEVLSRDAFARQREQERQSFATGVEELNLRGQTTTTASSDALGSNLLDYFGSLRAEETDENRFNINRYDSRYYYDRDAAMNMAIAKKNAKAAKSAGKSSMWGQIGGAAIGALGAAFL